MLILILRFISFVVGAFVVVLLVLSFIDEDFLVETDVAFGKTGIWYNDWYCMTKVMFIL